MPHVSGVINMHTLLPTRARLLLLACAVVLVAPLTASAQGPYAVGEKVEVGPLPWHPATVLKISGGSAYVHYDDKAFPDGWQAAYSIRKANTTAKNNAGVAAGPPMGKYNIYVYGGGPALYNGFFTLNNGSYQVFLPGGKPGGSGSYTYDAANTTFHWLSGPFKNPDINGTQKFEVDGTQKKIRLKLNMVGFFT